MGETDLKFVHKRGRSFRSIASLHLTENMGRSERPNLPIKAVSARNGCFFKIFNPLNAEPSVCIYSARSLRFEVTAGGTGHRIREKHQDAPPSNTASPLHNPACPSWDVSNSPPAHIQFRRYITLKLRVFDCILRLSAMLVEFAAAVTV